MTKQLGICQECQAQYEYEYNPKFPRKYCPPCSAAKQAAFKAVPNATTGVINPVQPQYAEEVVVQKIPGKPKIKEPNGEYQSLVYEKKLNANSYEVGKSGDRFKLYFETVEDLQAKMKELKEAGFMEEEIKPF